MDRLAVLAGLAVRDNETVEHPFIGSAFSLAIVTTENEMACDKPLSPRAKNADKGLGYLFGAGGAVPGLEWKRRESRPTHMSNYPMEQVDRVERPTTLIIDNEVPRVSKRAEFFERAARGDLGKKSMHERSRFSFKHPFAQAMVALSNAWCRNKMERLPKRFQDMKRCSMQSHEIPILFPRIGDDRHI